MRWVVCIAVNAMVVHASTVTPWANVACALAAWLLLWRLVLVPRHWPAH